MKGKFLTLATLTTVIATIVSGYIAILPNPTEAQTNLAEAANAIIIAGTTAIFGMVDDRDKDDEDNNRDTK